TGAARAELTIDDATPTPMFRLRARAAGSWANRALRAEISNVRNAGDPPNSLFDLAIYYGDDAEVFRNLQLADPTKAGYLFPVINRGSAFAVALPPDGGIGPAPDDSTELTFAAADTSATLTAGISLIWSHSGPGKVVVENDAGTTTFNLVVYADNNQLVERFDNLDVTADPQPDGTSAVIAALADSTYVTAQFALAASAPPPKQIKTFGDGTAGAIAGTEPNQAAYDGALDELTREGDVDTVLASVHGSDLNLYSSVYAAVAAHCINMSGEAKNRIGFGGVPDGLTVTEITDMAALFNSERFVLVAPAGLAGSVAGRIARLDYYRSPTFKNLSGVVSLTDDYLPSDLRTLLRANVAPVDLDRRLGFIVIKGITTSGEQISVTRVQDYAVRGVKRIADLFIGKLNNQLARLSLRQKLSEFFQQMEKDGAIVPSTDGQDPSFK
ncbi:MAG: phage tail sheath subtilisin-like domain-containing protein, partial [Myxococcota bacterium]